MYVSPSSCLRSIEAIVILMSRWSHCHCPNLISAPVTPVLYWINWEKQETVYCIANKILLWKNRSSMKINFPSIILQLPIDLWSHLKMEYCWLSVVLKTVLNQEKCLEINSTQIKCCLHHFMTNHGQVFWPRDLSRPLFRWHGDNIGKRRRMIFQTQADKFAIDRLMLEVLPTLGVIWSFKS